MLFLLHWSMTGHYKGKGRLPTRSDGSDDYPWLSHPIFKLAMMSALSSLARILKCFDNLNSSVVFYVIVY